MTEPQAPEHYRRQSSGTTPIGDTPMTRLRDKLAQMPKVNGQGRELVDPAEQLLADAVQRAEAINRDAAGRFAPAPAPQRPSAAGSTGHTAVPTREQTPLERIRAQAHRQYDHHTPDGYLPPTA